MDQAPITRRQGPWPAFCAKKTTGRGTNGGGNAGDSGP